MLTRHLPVMLVFVLLTCVLCVPRVQAAAITFTPTGVQLDADPILDLEVLQGVPLTFTIHVDTTGLPGVLVSLRYRLFLDLLEITPAPPFLEPIRTVFPDFEPPIPVSPFAPVIGHGGGSAAPGTTSEILRVHLQTIGQIPTLYGLDDNGLVDFSVILGQALALDPTGNLIDVTALFNPASPEIEVQPVPEPTSLVLVALGAALFVGRRVARTGLR